MKPVGAAERTTTAVVLVGYVGVVFALTCLKAFFRIGYLWDPANQRIRSLVLRPLDQLVGSEHWFHPVFEYVGNTALFVPVGALTVVWITAHSADSWWTSNPWHTIAAGLVAGLAASAVIEITQFAFGLGRSDVDDLFFNTLGAGIGAAVALLGHRWWHRLITGITALAVVVFIVLAILGPRLGDPEKVQPQAITFVQYVRCQYSFC